MKKLVILFPGAGYGLDNPLLYYSDFLFETMGYNRVHMNYIGILERKDLALEEKIKLLREYIWKRASEIDFGIYEEVVFLSKSVGAIEAGILVEKLKQERKLNQRIKHIFLTPVEDAIQYMNSESQIVIGTNDKAYSLYKEVCEKKSVKALYVEGADHSLEIHNSPFESIRVLEQVMHFISGKNEVN